MLYWAIAWGSVRTGAWWAFVPPTVMLTLIVFGLLLLQSSLNEVFNPRLRRGRARKKTAKAEGTAPVEVPVGVAQPEPVGTTGMLETPTTGREVR
jgi:peptide/nickel transport system permease protein